MKRVSLRSVHAALPEASRGVVQAIARVAETKGAAVFLVGGPVRDHLLGLTMRDADLVVDGAPDGAPGLAREAAPDGTRVVTHRRFGTARIETDGAVVDLATTRTERYARPGALPTVSPGHLEQDLVRRDFTVNALAIPLNEVAFAGRPRVIDPGTGLADLEAGVLRVFHARSFHDDPTRSLRAARFAARLGFRPTRTLRAALRGALRDGAFGSVSGERFRRELEKLFLEPALGLDPAAALRTLDTWHVLGALEPGLGLPRDSSRPLRRLGRSLCEPAWSDAAGLRPWVSGLACWLRPLAPALRRRVLRRLAVRGEAEQVIASFPGRHRGLLRSLGRIRGRGGVDALLAGIPSEELLAHTVCAPPPERRRIQRFLDEDRHRSVPIGGRELLALGLRGAAVGHALARVRAAWLDGSIRTEQEALALAGEVARRRNR